MTLYYVINAYLDMGLELMQQIERHKFENDPSEMLLLNVYCNRLQINYTTWSGWLMVTLLQRLVVLVLRR